MRKWLRRTVIAVPLVGIILAACGYAYLQHPKFGALPQGARLQAVERSAHYVNGAFQNLIDTPMRTQDTSFASNVISMLFDRNPKLKPSAALPSSRVDLKALPPQEDVVVWMGHSSYFVQLGGKRILIDPVFSTNAGPFPRTNQIDQASQGRPYRLLTPKPGALVALDQEGPPFPRWWMGEM